jgi:Na+-driven multidrug efflux pump
VITASYGIGANVLNFAVVPAMGFSMATSALVGQNIGAGQIARAEAVVRVSSMLSFCSLTGLGLLCLLGARHIAAFFVPGNMPVIVEASRFVRTVAWSFGFIGLQFALVGTLRATGDTMSAMVISLISQWVLQFPTAFVLSRPGTLGAHGLWWAFPAANVGTSLIAAAWFARGTWKEKRLVAHTAEQDVAEQTVIG